MASWTAWKSERNAPTNEMNVTPMLDVLLVLLVTFMASVVTMHHTMDAQLPEPCSHDCANGVGIVLEVLPGPTYRLNSMPLPSSELAARLRSVYAGRPDKTLEVVGDAGVTYAQMIDAMDVARGAGATVIGLSTERRR